MKRKRGSARRKPPKKPPVATANVEPANSAFQNNEENSHSDGNDGVDSKRKAEITHTGTNMICHQEACFLEDMDGGNSTPKSNLLKNVASFAAKLSKVVGSSSAEPTTSSLPLQDDIIQGMEPRLSHSGPVNDEQELNAALSVIKKIMKMEAAKPFNIPVDPVALGIPDYFEIVDKPMDFGTICNNIKWGGKYRNSKDVYKDVQLIFDNCTKYNKNGSYIMDLMKRVKINFIKHWNVAGLFRQRQEVDNETNLQSGSQRVAKKNKDGHVFPSSSMMSKSIRQEQQDIAGICQELQQQSSPCLSHTQSQHLPPECRGEQKSLGFQSKHSHHSGHLAATGHYHLPFHGVSSSSACKRCEHTCSSVPVVCNMSNHKQFGMCSCHSHEHQSVLRCSDQYQPQPKFCEHQSNPSEMLNAELDTTDDVADPHLHSPLESTVRCVKGRLGYPIATAAGHSHQKQSQNGLSEVQPASMFHGHSHRLQEKTSQGQLNVGLLETHQPQDKENVDHAAPAESTMRRAQGQHVSSGIPVADDFSEEEEYQEAPSESQSLSLGHSDQPGGNNTQHQPISSPLTSSLPQDSSSAARKSRVRGPTRCLKWLHEGKRIYVATNELGQPIGHDASKLISFLGLLARNGHMAPLSFVDWRAMPEEKKENMWQEVQEKFELDPNSKSWVIKSLSKKWKDWKSKLKTAHYITHTTDEERLADRDERVLPDQWAYLVSHWSSEAAERRSARNKANRAKQKFGHITGTKSFARIREEQREKRPDGKAPSRAELFILTRTRKDGKPVNEASSAVITQLREIANQPNAISQNSSDGDGVFSEIIGRDNRGRVRCDGLGPSPSVVNTTKAEALRMVATANTEVREMKERLVAMEQTCAQMAQQMATMMSMMSSMHNSSARDENLPPPARDVTGTSEVSPEQQVQSPSLRRSSRRTNI